MSPAGAVVASLLLSVCPPIPDDATGVCPQVYRVAGGVEPKDGLNFLFVGHGFGDDELLRYRCAVRLLTQSLSEMDPYSRAAPAINVYRMDLAIGGGMMTLDPVCGSRACTRMDVVWSDAEVERDCKPEIAGKIGTPTLPPSEVLGPCMLFDPDVSPCPGGNSSCRVSWPSDKGFVQLWRLSNCAPNIHAIIVLTDSGVKSGGGSEGHDPKMIVASLNSINGNGRAFTLAHEIGHAFGLLDEYAEDAVEVAGQLPDFQRGRNVFHMEESGAPAWRESCTEAHPELRDVEGCGVWDGAAELPMPSVGLIKGAFYRYEQYYRSEKSCLMQDDSEGRFCAGCKTYLNGLIDDLDLPEVSSRE